MKKIHFSSKTDGFTLLEIIVAFSLFSIMFLALMGGVAGSYSNVMNSNDRVTAIKEAQIVLNNIRLARDQGIAVPLGIVATFPQGPLNPPRTVLPNEVVTILYTNPAVSPLVVTVRVQWSTREGRVYTEDLTSIGTAQGMQRTVLQNFRIGGEMFGGFDYALLANNINCLLCHASIDNIERILNTEDENYSTFKRAKVASLESLMLRHDPSKSIDSGWNADSELAGSFYTRGDIVRVNSALVETESPWKYSTRQKVQDEQTMA